jgi:peptidoglycan/LPS O-acetylase OafA/YrhL
MRPIRAFGTISYGFYFFHALPVVLLGRVAEAHPAWSPA